MASTRPKNIFLKNVFVETVHEKKECEVIEQKNELPGKFTELQTWQTSTKIPCFNCHRTFNGIPWIEPRVLEQVNGKLTFKGYGCFCSEHCVQAYINVKKYSERAAGTSMLLVLCGIILGRPRKFITPSDSFVVLKKYGGDKTDDEYETYIETLRLSDQQFS